MKSFKSFLFLPNIPLGNVSLHLVWSLVIDHWFHTVSPDVGHFICGYLMLQVYMYTLFLCCSYWVRYDTALGTHQQWFLMIIFNGKWPYDGFIVIWMEFMTLTNIFYCSRGFYTSQPVLMVLSIHPYTTLAVIVSVQTEWSFLGQPFLYVIINRRGWETAMAGIWPMVSKTWTIYTYSGDWESIVPP